VWKNLFSSSEKGWDGCAGTNEETLWICMPAKVDGVARCDLHQGLCGQLIPVALGEKAGDVEGRVPEACLEPHRLPAEALV
jgi:hypothetical protein